MIINEHNRTAQLPKTVQLIMFSLQSIIFITIIISSSFFTVSFSANKKNDLKYAAQPSPLALIGQHVPQMPVCPPGLTYSPKYYRCLPNYVGTPVFPAPVPPIEIDPTSLGDSHTYGGVASAELPATNEFGTTAGQQFLDPLSSLAELFNLALIKFDRIEMKLDVVLSGVNALSQVMIQVLPQLAKTCQVNGNDGFASFLPFLNKMDSDQENTSPAALLQAMLDQKIFDTFNSDDSGSSFSDKMDSKDKNNEKLAEKSDNNSALNDEKQQQPQQESSKKNPLNMITIDQSEQLRKKEQELWRNIMEKIRQQINNNNGNLKSKSK